MSNLSDEQLIKSCIAGNKQHGKLLYERYKDYVACIVWSFVNDSELTRDFTQETFMRAFKALKRFKGEASFKTWLSQIAVNLCKDHRSRLEQRYKNAHISINDDEKDGERELSLQRKGNNPQDDVIAAERGKVVEKAVNKLSDDHKTAILLWQQGFSYKEIAAITNTLEKTVGTRIHYAMMKLSKLLKSYHKGNS